MKVKDVMVTDLVTVTPDTTVEEAVAIGQRHRVGTLPVVEGDRLVGHHNPFFFSAACPDEG